MRCRRLISLEKPDGFLLPLADGVFGKRWHGRLGSSELRRAVEGGGGRCGGRELCLIRKGSSCQPTLAKVVESKTKPKPSPKPRESGEGAKVGDGRMGEMHGSS